MGNSGNLQPLDLEQGRLGGDTAPGRVEHREFAPDHHAGHVLLGQFGRRVCADLLAITQNGDGVGQRLDLVEAVGDVKNGDALPAQAAHDVEQGFHFICREYGRGFIENHQPVIFKQRAGDLDQLPLCNGQGVDRVAR